MTTLWLQPGHGVGDPGATYGGRTEANEAQKLVNEAVKLAKPHLASGHAIRKMKNTDYVTAVNRFNREAGSLDLYIEVHFNSHTSRATGTEVLFGHKATARTLQTALVKQLGLADRGVKHRNDLYVTTSAVAGGERSGVIVEMAFINNPDDMAVIDKKGAHALATALVSLTHGKYTPIKEEDDMYNGKTAEQWFKERKKYRKAWKKETERRQEVQKKLKKCRTQRDRYHEEKKGLKADIVATEKAVDELRQKLEARDEDTDTKEKKLQQLEKELSRLRNKMTLSDALRVVVDKIKQMFR